MSRTVVEWRKAPSHPWRVYEVRETEGEAWTVGEELAGWGYETAISAGARGARMTPKWQRARLLPPPRGFGPDPVSLVGKLLWVTGQPIWPTGHSVTTVGAHFIPLAPGMQTHLVREDECPVFASLPCLELLAEFADAVEPVALAEWLKESA